MLTGQKHIIRAALLCSAMLSLLICLTGSTPAYAQNVNVGNLEVQVRYNGQPPSSLGAVCNFNHTLDGFGFLGNLCDSATSTNIPVGQYTVRLGYAFGNGNLVNPIPVTIVGGATTTVTFEVGATVGIVKGSATINGQPPGQGFGVCGSTNGKACKGFPPGDGAFRLLLPAGNGSGFVWGSSCECIQLKSFNFSVAAGAETDVGVIDASQGSLEVQVKYNGQPPSSLGAVCNFNHNLEGFGFLGNLCDSATTNNIPAGQYTLHLGYAFGSGDLVSPIPVTITGGATTTVTFEVGATVGIVKGNATINGQPPGQGFGVCGQTNGKACKGFPPSDGAFRLLLPAGNGSGFVWGSSCECIQLKSFNFSVAAGVETDVGTINAAQGSLEVQVRYNGQPPSSLGAVCNFNHNLEGFGFLGNLCDSATTNNIPAGQYTLHLGYAFGSGDLVSPIPVTITGGGTTTVTFEVGGTVGILKGNVLVNGQPPGPGFGVCGQTNGKACKGFPPGDGAFRLLLPAGAGCGFVWANSCECHQIGSFCYNVVAGQETDVNNPLDTPPTISAVGVTRQQGSPLSTSIIANVDDAQDAKNTLTVTVANATVNGVTITLIDSNPGAPGINPDATGQVFASVVAACGASDATFTLMVTDGGGSSASATLIVTVSSNTPPILGSYPSAGAIPPGAGATVTPNLPPTDNVSINSITATAPGFTGVLSVNPATGAVTVSNAGPAGYYVVTVTATDNCGATTSKTFNLFVNCPGATITVTGAADGPLASLAGNGTCDLREAITAANTNAAVGECPAGVPGLDKIYFAIGAGTPTINVTGSALPTIIQPVVIDGSQCQSTRVELNGLGAGASANGLVLSAGNCEIRGLVINRFNGSISNTTGIGILVYGSGNVIENCYIGVNAAGDQDAGNKEDGILIYSSNNRIGGALAGTRNVISGNDRSGVEFATSGHHNLVQGNFIGTDASGKLKLGNTNYGIYVGSAPQNTIGGASAASRNVISGNKREGIVLQYGATGNSILGNYIGADVDGVNNLGNGLHGITIRAASNNTIGGGAAGAGNVIRFNLGSGIFVDDSLGATAGNAILANSISSNSALGIDLSPSGVTANDAGDGDAGSNNRQNFPLLASSAGIITGWLNSAIANSAYPARIEFFANATCDSSGYGEGEVFLGFMTLNTPGGFTASLTPIPGKPFITATATDNNGNTSEFSGCVMLNTLPTITPSSALTRQTGSPGGAPVTIASVSDAQTPANSLTVTATKVPKDVTVTNIVNTNGLITAIVTADCKAKLGADTITLMVTDGGGLTATANLTINITADTPPALGLYPAVVTINQGAGTIVTPDAPPTDNGAVSLSVDAPNKFKGGLSVNSATGAVTISNAMPAGTYTVTVTAKDNCGATTTRTFDLKVN